MLNETLMLLTIEERLIEPNIALLELKGKLAIGREIQRVETLIETMVLDGRTRAIFDLSGVDYTDSAGIGMVVLAAGKLKGAGGKLVVVAAHGGRVHQMLALTQINSIVQVCGTVVEAIAAFGETLPPAAA